MPPIDALPPADLTPWHMLANADIVVKLVMAVLLLASIATWTILGGKLWELRTANARVRSRLAAALAAPSLSALAAGGMPDPMRDAAADEMERSRGLPVEGTKERLAQRLARLETAAVRRVTRGIGILAIVGSVGPFVGLFGTVWGIMNSFVGISRMQTTNLAVVAPGIAEALLATATGLVAAIPAVVIYNVFARMTGGFRVLCGDLSTATWTLASRDLDRRVVSEASARSPAPRAAAAE